MSGIRALDAAVEFLTKPEIPDPVPLYEALRTAGAQFRTPFGITLVTGYKMGREVLRHPDFGVSDAGRMDRVWPTWRDHATARQFSESMFGTNPPSHAAMRQPFRHSFSAAGIREFTPAVEGAVERRVTAVRARLEDGDAVDIVEAVARPVAVELTCDMLGVRPDDRDLVAASVADWTPSLELTRTSEQLAIADEAVVAIEALATDMLDLRGPATTPLLTAVQASQMSPTASRSNIASVLAAGIETTASLLTHLAVILLDNSDARRALDADPAHANQIVNECLRFSPSLHTAARVATKRIAVGDARFDEGDEVLVLLAACNRDAEVFTQPHEFNWRRDSPRHLSFGGGLHHCLGALLATTAAVTFARHFANLGAVVRHGQRSAPSGVVLRRHPALIVVRPTQATSASHVSPTAD